MRPRDPQLMERLVALVVDLALYCPDGGVIRAAARLACRAYRAGVVLSRRELRDAATATAWLEEVSDPLAWRASWSTRERRAAGDRVLALRALRRAILDRRASREVAA